jgi:hypothetical protein
MNWIEDKRKDFANNYIYTCKLFDKVIDYNMARMVINDLQDLDADACINALEVFRKDEKNRFWPKPNDIRGLVKPKTNSAMQSIEVASRIRLAIEKYGWTNPAPAREYIGELGWMVVNRFGGWSYLCENLGVELSPLTFHAQARELTNAIIESARLGNFDTPIALPEIRQTNDLSSMKDILKLIPTKGK